MRRVESESLDTDRDQVVQLLFTPRGSTHSTSDPDGSSPKSTQLSNTRSNARTPDPGEPGTNRGLALDPDELDLAAIATEA